MNTFDIVVIVVTSFCLIRGFFKGLIGEVSGIIGIVAGLYGALTYYPLLAVYIEPWINSPWVRNLLVFFVLFCAILLVVGFLAALIRKLLKLVFLGWVDRMFGLIFGGIKGILFVSALFIAITSFLPENPRFLKESKLSPHIAQVSKSLTIFISNNSKKDFLKKLEGLF